MAAASKKRSRAEKAKSPKPAPPSEAGPAPSISSTPAAAVTTADRMFGWMDATYHFLASLKLAVISISTLAAALAFATFYESWYGGRAVGEDIYKSPLFKLIMAFLAANILCAALIRYPWKRRQTGFVVTHAGLLTVVLGSYITLRISDEGQLAMLEGESTTRVVRNDEAILRVKQLSEDGRPAMHHQIPFRPGSELWNPARHGKPIDVRRAVSLAIFHPFSFHDVGRALGAVFASEKMPPRTAVLPVADNDFGLEVLDHIPTSGTKVLHQKADPDQVGYPMIKLAGKIQPPNSARLQDLFPADDLSWLTADNFLLRQTQSLGPAQIVFQYADSAQIVEDFLNPPKDPGEFGALWLTYKDKSGKPRRVEWTLKSERGDTLTLPDSDFTVTAEEVRTLEPAALQEMMQAEEPQLRAMARKLAIAYQANGGPLAYVGCKVKNGQGQESRLLAFDQVPSGLLGSNAERTGGLEAGFFRNPVPAGGRSFGRVEILATKEGKLYHRVFGRKGLRSIGPLALNQNVLAFGGEGSPMKLSFAVEDFIESGVEKQVCVPITLPQNQSAGGIPAALLRMTVKGDSKEFWVRSSPDFEERPHPVHFPSGDYEVSYDMKRHDLDFQIELVDFEVGMDPGTQRPATFTSEILVSEPVPTLKGDPKAAIREMPFTLGAGGAVNDVNKRPYTVSMNEPYHNGYWTFYQSSYQDMENGTFRSIFQVRYDPIWAWGTVYLGCLTVLVGIWLQFYMRAGVFSTTARQTAARALGFGADRAASENGHPPAQAAVGQAQESEERL